MDYCYEKNIKFWGLIGSTRSERLAAISYSCYNGGATEPMSTKIYDSNCQVIIGFDGRIRCKLTKLYVKRWLHVYVFIYLFAQT